ncbi:hypothetical protein D1B31_02935 [Neobacillus notoginsengisoli]|uniref:Uncharacterized protein n=1 Tax=Neobacillus notoginsengisoli TaxID=1578198 RepID=A0A417YXU6_9BACI|nr:hypothetical protein [Neobacillus notoginsengisoli]RHW42566.1 hypothetical protein D1B31_02935 [Neobacillus notoginsengisoli]
MNRKLGFIIIAVLILVVTVGSYVVYGATKDKKAENSVNEAKSSASDLYKEMEEKIDTGKETGHFAKVDREKILKAEALVSIAKADLKEATNKTSREYKEILQDEVESMIGQLREYNKGAAIAEPLYERIYAAEKLAAENPLSPDLLEELPLLKADVLEGNKEFKKLKPPFHDLFADRYILEVEKLEGIMNLFVTAEQAVQTLIDMSESEKTIKADFDKKYEEAKKLVEELSNESAKNELTAEMETAAKAFANADKKRDEEAKKKEEDEAKTFTGPEGEMYELGEGPSFDPAWSVAKKHGARLYFMPDSDVMIFVKDNSRILTMSAGFIGTDLNHGNILADLLTARGYKITQKEMNNVIQSGTPFEKEKEMFRVYREGKKLIAETW